MVFFVESSETSHMCPICHSYHTELPDCLVPYKHYEAEVISGVLDEVVRPENLDSEDYPSFSTMRRWMQWFVENLTRIEGYLRTAGFHLLACGLQGQPLDMARRSGLHALLESGLEPDLPRAVAAAQALLQGHD